MDDGESVGGDHLMTTAEVARRFRVDPTTVNRWAKAGRLAGIQVFPGAHRRFRESEIRALLEGGDDGNDDQGSR